MGHRARFVTLLEADGGLQLSIQALDCTWLSHSGTATRSRALYDNEQIRNIIEEERNAADGLIDSGTPTLRSSPMRTCDSHRVQQLQTNARVAAVTLCFFTRA